MITIKINNDMSCIVGGSSFLLGGKITQYNGRFYTTHHKYMWSQWRALEVLFQDKMVVKHNTIIIRWLLMFDIFVDWSKNKTCKHYLECITTFMCSKH